MNDEKFDVQSDGSGGSVEALAVDLSIQRLSTDNVNTLILKTTVPPLLIGTLDALVRLAEYTLLFYYCGTNAIALHAVYQPLELMLNSYAPYSFAIATSMFISRALAQGHANVANIYLSHFFFIIFLWGIIVPIFFASPYKQLSAFLSVFNNREDYFGYYYYLWMFIGGPMLTAFANSIQPLLKVENRDCIYTMRSAISLLLQLFFTLMLLYASSMHNPISNSESLYYLAIAYLATNLIITSWMVLIFFRKSCLLILLKGCLRFSLRRLFPINIKIIWRILLFSIPQWFLLAQMQLVTIIMNLFYGYFYSDTESLVYRRVGYSLYTRFYTLSSVLTGAFLQGFAQILGFNLAIKRFRRVKQTIVLTMIYVCILPVIFSYILLIISDSLTEGIQPRYEVKPDWLDAFNEEIKPITRWAFVTPPLLGPYYIVSTAAHIEGKILLPIILQLSRSVPALLSLVIMAFLVGDQADFTFAFPIGDICGATLGIVLLVQYVVKYSMLAKLDVGTDDHQDDVLEGSEEHPDDYRSSNSYDYDQSSEYTTTIHESSVTGRFLDSDSTINASYTDGDAGGHRRKEDSSWYDESSQNKGPADLRRDTSDNWDGKTTVVDKRQ